MCLPVREVVAAAIRLIARCDSYGDRSQFERAACIEQMPGARHICCERANRISACLADLCLSPKVEDELGPRPPDRRGNAHLILESSDMAL